MEKLISIFRKVVVLDIILSIILMIAYIIFDSNIDSDIVYSTTYLIIYLSLALGVLLFQIVLYYLLLKLKPAGKKLFIPFLIVVSVFTLLLPEDQTIYPNFVLLLEWFQGMTWGAIFTLMYFTDLKNKFDG